MYQLVNYTLSQKNCASVNLLITPWNVYMSTFQPTSP